MVSPLGADVIAWDSYLKSDRLILSWVRLRSFLKPVLRWVPILEKFKNPGGVFSSPSAYYLRKEHYIHLLDPESEYVLLTERTLYTPFGPRVRVRITYGKNIIYSFWTPSPSAHYSRKEHYISLLDPESEWV